MVNWRNNCAYEEAVKVRKDTGLGVYSAQNRAGSYTPFGAVLLGCGANSIWSIGEKIAGWCTNDDESSSESSDVQRYKDQIDSILSVHNVGNVSELGLLLESKKQELFDLQGELQIYEDMLNSYTELLTDPENTSNVHPGNIRQTINSVEASKRELEAQITKLTAEVEKLERDCAAVKEYTEKLENLEQDEYINSQVNDNTKNFTDLLRQLNKAQAEKKPTSEIDSLVDQITSAYEALGSNPPTHIKTAYDFLKGEIKAANRRKNSANATT